MKEQKKNFIPQIEELCRGYKEYLKKHQDTNLEITIDNKQIKLLLKEKDILEPIDEFSLTFTQYEVEQYKYISCIIIRNLYDRGYIYNEGTYFYQDGKNNIKIYVEDGKVIEEMLNLLTYPTIPQNQKIEKKLNKHQEELNKRVSLTKKLLFPRGKQ